MALSNNAYANGVKVRNWYDAITLPWQFSIDKLFTKNRDKDTNDRYLPQKSEGFMANLQGRNVEYKNAGNLGRWIKTYLNSQNLNQTTKDWINSLSDTALGGLANEYWGVSSTSLGDETSTFDIDSFLQDINKFSEIDMPEARSFQDVWDEAAGKIDAENAQAAALYDNALKYQQDIYNRQLSGLGNDYNTYARQVLAMDYVKNQQLLGNLEGTMNKARQNALEAGASAGVRLANNVNTLMSTQNQQAQQSLQTSNNLAQMLVNQRNAAMGLQSNLANAYATNANQKAGLVKGDFERKQAAAGSAWDNYQQSYNDKVNAATNSLGGGQLADSYATYLQSNQYKNKNTSTSRSGNGTY